MSPNSNSFPASFFLSTFWSSKGTKGKSTSQLQHPACSTSLRFTLGRISLSSKERNSLGEKNRNRMELCKSGNLNKKRAIPNRSEELDCEQTSGGSAEVRAYVPPFCFIGINRMKFSKPRRLRSATVCVNLLSTSGLPACLPACCTKQFHEKTRTDFFSLCFLYVILRDRRQERWLSEEGKSSAARSRHTKNCTGSSSSSLLLLPSLFVLHQRSTS
jgi:hypothetical protein